MAKVPTLTAAATATGSFHTVTFTAGPMDRPADTYRFTIQVSSLDAIQRHIDMMQAEGREPVLGFVQDRRLRVGQEVLVHGFGGSRQGVIDGFTRTKVVVTFVKNKAGDKATAAFPHHEVRTV